MRKTILILFGVIILITVNFLIYEKEGVLAEGKTVLLRLAPVDPRSLMQGDYMILRYAIAGMADRIQLEEGKSEGRVVLVLSNNAVAEYVRMARSRETRETLGSGEVFLKYKLRRGRLRFGAESYFFQEGRSQFYSAATIGVNPASCRR